jgi:hypothetical protein
MVIWSRLGFLVAVFVFGCSLAANLITNHLTGSEEYWNAHKWPFGVSLLVSGLLSWVVGSWLAHAKERTLVDKETGEETVVTPNHTLFFIKMHWWGPVLGVIGIVLIALHFAK